MDFDFEGLEEAEPAAMAQITCMSESAFRRFRSRLEEAEGSRRYDHFCDAVAEAIWNEATVAERMPKIVKAFQSLLDEVTRRSPPDIEAGGAICYLLWQLGLSTSLQETRVRPSARPAAPVALVTGFGGSNVEDLESQAAWYESQGFHVISTSRAGFPPVLQQKHNFIVAQELRSVLQAGSDVVLHLCSQYGVVFGVEILWLWAHNSPPFDRLPPVGGCLKAVVFDCAAPPNFDPVSQSILYPTDEAGIEWMLGPQPSPFCSGENAMFGCCQKPSVGDDFEVAGGSAVAVDKLNNIVMLTDSYKVTHHLQYPPGTETVYSYFECRGGAYEEVCFFGLQYFLKKYMTGVVVTTEKINEAETYFKAHFDHPVWKYDEKLFNRASWEYIVSKHGGKLPVSVKAVPEGTVLPYKNVLFTLENTDPKCYWLTNYLETLLVQVWYPTTVCTQSREQKKIIMKYLQQTGSQDVIDKGLHLFKLHDFGFRGVSSVESAATGGAAHLVNFLGTDTMAALMMLKEYYGNACAGFSIPASEHSTMTSWGKEKEVDAMRNMLQQYPKGIVACVSDSYDIFKACEQYWGTELKSLIEARDGFLVVRPDSGELPNIVLQVLEKLASKFGTVDTSTGHKLLPPCIRVIQGDGIDITSLEMILKAMSDKKWGADNLAFGSGGALLQKLHRDTQKCAFKCSYCVVNGQGVDVVKDPITDPGKKSKKGKLTLECKDGKWTTVTEGKGSAANDELVEIFRDGTLLVDDTLDTVRSRSNGEKVAVTKVSKPLSLAGDIFNNIVMLTDSYKVTHHKQYPPGTEVVYSYFESRGGAYADVCFFGLQYYLKKYLAGQVVTPDKVGAAESYFKAHFSHPVWGYDETLFHRAGWEHIMKQHGGKLPIVIKAVPEGTVLPYKNVLFTLENTDPKCYWLTNYLETLLVQVWYPTTVCTQSREQKKIILKYLKETGSQDVIDNGLHVFKLHDFGFRGVSSVESAATGGAGHLVNFRGTDTMAALVMLKEYYAEPCAGNSIPASEHSTMTSWTREKEVDAMRNMLQQYPKGIVACVSDSFDIFKACEQYWGTELKSLIEARDGFLVVRPDSGELPAIVLQVLEKLAGKFGTVETSNGFKLLPPCIRIIQGDGIDINTLEMILKAMKDKKWGADNLAFGSGGALLQKLHRDTQKCAFKCSYASVNGQGVDVVKDPITDPGKKSKKGRLTLELSNGTWTTVTEGKGAAANDKLVEVFRDGVVKVDDSFQTIRDRSNAA